MVWVAALYTVLLLPETMVTGAGVMLALLVSVVLPSA